MTTMRRLGVEAGRRDYIEGRIEPMLNEVPQTFEAAVDWLKGWYRGWHSASGLPQEEPAQDEAPVDDRDEGLDPPLHCRTEDDGPPRGCPANRYRRT